MFYALDCNEIRQSIESQQLKHYWVAEQAGVHKTTLRRWLNRSISRVEKKRLARLADVLQRDWQQLVINSPCQT